MKAASAVRSICLYIRGRKTAPFMARMRFWPFPSFKISKDNAILRFGKPRSPVLSNSTESLPVFVGGSARGALLSCAAAVLLSAACIYHYAGSYASARKELFNARRKYAALSSLLSLKGTVSSFAAGGTVRSYAASAAEELERLAGCCGVRVVSLRAGVSRSVPGTVVLEPEISGNEAGLLSFVSELERSLYVFTIEKARIDLPARDGGRLRARFTVSSARDLPVNAGSDPLNAVELFSRPVREALKNGDTGCGRLFRDAGQMETEALPAAAAGEDGGSGGLKLTGVILGAKPAAFLRDTSSGREFRLYPGQQINGFRLERVMKGRAILSKGDKLYELSF